MSHVAVRPSLDILSICTGGGGLDLGVELAIPSARSVVLVEREAFAVAQLVSAMEAGLLHQAPVWSDAKSFDGRRWRGCVDGLIGGIPCQGHSLAGKKRGSLDERDLWSPARRIIVQARPWFVLIENVGGMLSPGDDDIAGAERVRRDLLKLGFSVEGGLFTASEVGASHERERIFILGVADGYNEHDHGRWVERAGRRGQSPDCGSDVADTGRDEPSSGRRDVGEVRSLSEAQRRAEHGATLSGGGGSELADPFSARLEGSERRTARSGNEGCAAQRDRQGVVDASRDGLGEGRAEPELRSGRDALASADGAMGDAICGGYHGRENVALGRQIERTSAEGTSGRSIRAMADAHIVELRREPSTRQLEVDERHAGPGTFPPGPSDLSGWRGILERAPELEPAFRRVADGLASRLDIARVDRLRMLGNGVVPLQAAYAVRTLATRLADRGSAGATRLVRMMEQQP